MPTFNAMIPGPHSLVLLPSCFAALRRVSRVVWHPTPPSNTASHRHTHMRLTKDTHSVVSLQCELERMRRTGSITLDSLDVSTARMLAGKIPGILECCRYVLPCAKRQWY